MNNMTNMNNEEEEEELKDKALKQAYIQYLSEKPQTPTRPGFSDVYTMSKEESKKEKGSPILAGIVGLLRGLSSPSGQKILSGTTKNPYKQAAFLKQASEKERSLAGQQSAYIAERAPRMQQLGQYVRERQAARDAARLTAQKQITEQLQETELTPEEKFKRETDLRKEVNTQIGDFPKVTQSYQRIVSVSKEPSGAGDLALIFNYMKMLDPSSVVRESEFATAQNSAGVPERIRAMHNKVLSGERLSTKTREDFINKSNALYNARKVQYEQTIGSYKKIAEAEGLDPERIFIKRGFVGKHKDEYGYTLGQKKMRGGKQYTYVGGNQWQEE